MIAEDPSQWTQPGATAPHKGLAGNLASLSEDQRAAFFASLSESEAAALEYDWKFWARPNQLQPEGGWSTWLILAGRGFGKTRALSEWVRSEKNRVGRIAIVGPTAADARDVLVEGESGIIAISPPDDRPVYEPSKRRLTWPNGTIATTYSADEPDRLRGPQHGSAICDEIAAWRYPEAWDMLMFGLRLGSDPRCVAATTPKPVKLLRDILASPGTIVTRGSTYDNAANLAPTFLAKIISKYQGTRLGRQEINAELLEDIAGAIWTRAMLDANRMQALPEGLPPYEAPGYHRALAEALGLSRIVIGVDPSGSSGEDDEKADEIGIVAAGIDYSGRGYILEDVSGSYSPEGWGAAVVQIYDRWGADLVAAEINFGGAMVVSTIRGAKRGRTVAVETITASRGKAIRAEPVASLYEQGRVTHVGSFGTLEDQLCSFTRQKYQGKGSPDRADAAIFALTNLMLDESGGYDLMGAMGMR